MKTETSKNKAGNRNQAQTALADLNAQIEALKQQRTALAEPLKGRWAELRTELVDMEAQIRELDPIWKPASLRPKAEDKIMEILTASAGPMTTEEIVAAVGGVLNSWKVKSVLKKRSTGAKAVFAVNDGRYSIKSSGA